MPLRLSSPAASALLHSRKARAFRVFLAADAGVRSGGCLGLFALLMSDHVPDHLGVALALLRLPLQALLEGAALPLHDLEQESFALAQELQAFLGEVDVGARRLQEKYCDGEDTHTRSKYGPDANIHQRRVHSSCLLPTPPDAGPRRLLSGIKSYERKDSKP